MTPASPSLLEITFTLNQRPLTTTVRVTDRLLDLLRDQLRLTGTKEGCGEGECGACTVTIDGVPANSCLVPAYQIRGRSVETIESIPEERLQPYLQEGATQCGACTPGVAMTADWVVRHPELLDTHDLRELMAGNLCRCTGYDGIIDALARAIREDGA